MYDFNYQRAGSVAEASNAIKSASDGMVLAGGMTLIPTLKQRLANPSDLIDLGGIGELTAIGREGDGVSIGAMATHAAVAGSKDVKAKIPALAALAGSIGDAQVRNRGTIGGSVANNDPASDYPAACLALGATIRTNEREIAAADFFTGLFETTLNDSEIVMAVSFPAAEKAAYAKFPNPASRYALVGVFVAKTSDGARVAVSGAGADGVFRVAEMESALDGDFSAAALDGISVPAGALNSDIHASAEYRAHLIGVMARRAVEACG